MGKRRSSSSSLGSASKRSKGKREGADENKENSILLLSHLDEGAVDAVDAIVAPPEKEFDQDEGDVDAENMEADAHDNDDEYGERKSDEEKQEENERVEEENHDEVREHDDMSACASASAASGQKKSSTQPGKTTEAGIIKSIYCENFMCHRKLQVDLNRNVNFIHGQNGSGTSYFLIGLFIGLLVKATVHALQCVLRC
jgi:hypothetical protein